MFYACGVKQLYITSDSHVLVDDGSADLAVWPDADVVCHGIEIRSYLFQGLVVIRPHHDRILDPCARVDTAAKADDGVAGVDSVEDASFADHRIADIAIMHFRGGQIAAAGVYRSRRVEEIELGQGRSQIEISIVESPDRSNVFPIVVK